MREKRETMEMTWIDKEYKGIQSRLAGLQAQNDRRKVKFGAWIAKAITRKQGCENQITTQYQRGMKATDFDETELKAEIKRQAELYVISPRSPYPPEI